jgi:hypothetical protein
LDNFFVSNKFNDLHGDASPKINNLQTLPEFSVEEKTAQCEDRK